MTQKTTLGRPRSRRSRGWGIGGLALLGVAFVAGLIFALGYLGFFHTVTVGDLLANDEVIQPLEATEELCADVGCVEGWRTDHGAFLRFGRTGEAEYWETVLGDDGRRWDKIVLDMRGKDLTFDEKRHAIDTLYNYHDWF